MSISDYETLQNELYEIGNRANTSIVTVTKMKNEDDWIMEENKSGTQGAGVIISQDDNYLYVLTERKIILEAPHIRVSFVDGTGAEATLFRYDANTGLAVLTVEKRLLKPDTKRVITVAKMGYMSMVKNGTLVIALGSPLETNYSILTGNITSVENKVMTKDKNYSIYTTDILASKNGSGILINTNGEVIGVVIQDFCGTQDVSTLTAVAINDISGIIEKMKAGKDIPYVGVYLSTVTDDIAKNYDIPKGVFVKEIVADSPAMKAGIQHGDVITNINGEVVQTDTVFSQKISQLIPGTSCEITLKRQNGNEYYEVKCTVTIGVLE
jgi:serine protease Do